jgi:hypothetical protein
MKPGWKTTEFWNTILTHAVSLATLFGVINNTQAGFFQEQASKTIAAAIVIVSNVVLAWKYIHDRTGLKAEGMKTVQVPIAKDQRATRPE